MPPHDRDWEPADGHVGGMSGGGSLSAVTLTARSRAKTTRQAISTLSVRPQGGSQGRCLKRGSEVRVREEGLSMKASARTTAMTTPNPLCTGERDTAGAPVSHAPPQRRQPGNAGAWPNAGVSHVRYVSPRRQSEPKAWLY